MNEAFIDKAPGKIKLESVWHVTEAGAAEITPTISEINIHSSVYTTSSFCELTMVDSTNYIANGNVNSGDSFKVEISFHDETKSYKYKLSSITDIKNFENSRAFNLKLISDFEYYSIYRKISQSYVGRTSDIASSIFESHTEEKGDIWEASSGVETVCIPNWSPMKTCQWLASRSRSPVSPGRFLFFQDSRQYYHFTSLEHYWSLHGDPVATYRYSSNNLGKANSSGVNPDSKSTVFSIFNIDFFNLYDIKKAYDSGILRNTKIRTDLTTKTIDYLQNTYWDTYFQRSLNKYPSWPHEISEPGNIFYETTTWESATTGGFNKVSDETTAHPALDKTQQMEIIVIGNNAVDVGMVVNIEIPSPEPESSVKEHDLDPVWSGKYYVISKRDQFDRTGHRMALRLAKGSHSSGGGYV